GVAIALTSTMIVSADSRPNEASTPPPIAYTQYYCVIPPDGAYCSPASNVTTPYANTVGPYDFWPSWSPDATQIAFTSDHEVFVMDAAPPTFLNITNPDGGNIFEVPPLSGGPTRATWSPDNTRLAFECEVDAGNRDICAINV